MFSPIMNSKYMYSHWNFNLLTQSVIERHLLSMPNDPFNRAPLTVAMLVPNVALKREIEAWRQSVAKK